MKTLYLLRHAKAETGTQAMRDEARPLSVRGQQACVMIGGYMRTRQYVPAQALVSPAMRTRETFERVTEAAQMQLKISFEKRLYLASADDIVQCVQEVNDSADSLLVVGHNPGMHHVAVSLAMPVASSLYESLVLKYPTGTLTVLQFDITHWADLQPESGILRDVRTPKELL